jgi:hypothetical protein
MCLGLGRAKSCMYCMTADKKVLMHWSLVAAAEAAAAATVAGAEQLGPRVFVVLHLGGLLQSNLLVEML